MMEPYQDPSSFPRSFPSPHSSSRPDSWPPADTNPNTDRSSVGFHTARSNRSVKGGMRTSPGPPARAAAPSETASYAASAEPYFLTPRDHTNQLDWDQLSDTDPLGPSELSDHWLLEALAKLADPFGLVVRCVVPTYCSQPSSSGERTLWLEEDQVAKREEPLYVNVNGTLVQPDDAGADDRSEYHSTTSECPPVRRLHPYLPHDLQQSPPEKISSAQCPWLASNLASASSASQSAPPSPAPSVAPSVRTSRSSQRFTSDRRERQSVGPSRLSSAMPSSTASRRSTAASSTRSSPRLQASLLSSAAYPRPQPSQRASWLPANERRFEPSPPARASARPPSPDVVPKSYRGRAWCWLQKKVFRKPSTKKEGGYLGRL